MLFEHIQIIRVCLFYEERKEIGVILKLNKRITRDSKAFLHVEGLEQTDSRRQGMAVFENGPHKSCVSTIKITLVMLSVVVGTAGR